MNEKVDLHIHTLSTTSDGHIDFSMDKLQEYVQVREIDCIAITNHNTFGLEQFNEIKESISIAVFQGIEIDLEGGQILLISDGTDLSDFNKKCQDVSDTSPTKRDSLSVHDLQRIFENLSTYILIPHYDKKPRVKEETLAELGSFVTAGEVTSPKKFVYCIKDKERLVPVYLVTAE